MKGIVYDRCGDPAEVLQVRDIPTPEPGAGQVRVRMLLSPVNPSDLMIVRGQYGRKQDLPATPGFEGVGIIEATGPGLLKHILRLKPGRRVAVLNGQGGDWAEQVVIPAQQAIRIADGIPDEQAASFFVNPATALIMTQNVLKVPQGAWLLQTAAGSALGRMVIRLGQHFGFRTINIVRRREQVDELVKIGATAVICSSDESVVERVKTLTDGKGVPFAIDAVGGDTGSTALLCLGFNGRMLVYGTLSPDPLSIDQRRLMTFNSSVEGFWLSIWMREQRKLTLLGLFRRINQMMKAGILTSEVGRTFGFNEIQEAVKQAETPGRQGKVLLKLS